MVEYVFCIHAVLSLYGKDRLSKGLGLLQVVLLKVQARYAPLRSERAAPFDLSG